MYPLPQVNYGATPKFEEEMLHTSPYNTSQPCRLAVISKAIVCLFVSVVLFWSVNVKTKNIIEQYSFSAVLDSPEDENFAVTNEMTSISFVKKQKNKSASIDIKTNKSSKKRPNVIFWMADDMQMVFDDAAALPPGVQVKTAPVPNHEAIRQQSLIFTQAYAASPKCAPARFNILTMKYCSRGVNSRRETLNSFNPDGRVTVSDTCRIAEEDQAETLPSILLANGYETIQSGKWHQIGGLTHDWELSYEEVVEKIKSTGFSRVGGAYASNVPRPEEFYKLGVNFPTDLQFSHNMEWELGAALREIDEVVSSNKPFFLYFAATAPNNYVNYYEALNKDPRLTPKGVIPESELYPTGMPSRESVWERALKAANGHVDKASAGTFAGHIWVDDALGALVQHLENLGILENTILVVTTDHGMVAKGHLYQGGIKVFNFIRFPQISSPTVEKRVDDVVIANIDLGATILDYLGIPVPYEHDGKSFLNAIREPFDGGREYLITEVANDRSVLDRSKNQKYISRSWLDTHEVQNPHNYPDFTDAEQLYNLSTDTMEQQSIAYCLQEDPDVETYRRLVCAHDQMFLISSEIGTGPCPAVDWNKNNYITKECSFSS